MKIIQVKDLAYPQGVLRGGDVYVELGAYLGRFLKASGLRNPHNIYHLVEPQEEYVKHLAELHKDHPNVTIHAVAIANHEGVVELHLNEQGSSLHYADTDKSIAVRAITLAMLMGDTGPIRFLAVNIEGAEYGLFTDKVSLERVDYIACEFHPGKSGFDTDCYVADNLALQFETLAMYRHGEAYNIWVGRNLNAVD